VRDPAARTFGLPSWQKRKGDSRQESASAAPLSGSALPAKGFPDGTIDARSEPEMKTTRLFLCGLLLAAAGWGCGHAQYLPGTNIPATEENQSIIDTIEEYRARLMDKDIEQLMLLASKKYFEDGGTPRPTDDYGYDGLRKILNSRLLRVESIRYDILYKHIRMRSDGRAEVEAFLNGAFELQGEVGERYRRVNDYHRFVLERSTTGGSAKWKFVSGM
jgi:hypothetical protein